MVEDKMEKKQKNKGITVSPSNVMKDNIYFSDTETFSRSLGAVKSISKVKNDLQTVIDLMGPNTPHFPQSPSNDGDNESSVTWEATDKSVEKSKVEQPSEVYSQITNTTDKTMPPDITLEEDTDISIVAGKNSTTQELPQYVCPPPLLPANIMYNSECMCPQIANFIQTGTASVPCMGGVQKQKKIGKHKNLLYNFFKNFTTRSEEFYPEKREYYTMNMKESQNDNGPPRRLIFDLVGDVPKRSYKLDDDLNNDPYFNQTFSSGKTKEIKNFNNEQLSKEVQQNETVPAPKESVLTFDKASRKFNQRTVYTDSNGTTRVDVYYFDHGDSGYLKTTDSPPVVATENLAEKTEAYTTRFWAEIFGTLHIGVSFCTSFVLQLFRFLLYSVLRPLTVGLVQLGTDYFLKPCIATLFNAIVQPPLIFLYNVFTSLRDLCYPIAEGMGYFLREAAIFVRAFRIVDIRREKSLEYVSNEKKEKIEQKTELVT